MADDFFANINKKYNLPTPKAPAASGSGRVTPGKKDPFFDQINAKYNAPKPVAYPSNFVGAIPAGASRTGPAIPPPQPKITVGPSNDTRTIVMGPAEPTPTITLNRAGGSGLGDQGAPQDFLGQHPQQQRRTVLPTPKPDPVTQAVLPAAREQDDFFKTITQKYKLPDVTGVDGTRAPYTPPPNGFFSEETTKNLLDYYTKIYGEETARKLVYQQDVNAAQVVGRDPFATEAQQKAREIAEFTQTPTADLMFGNDHSKITAPIRGIAKFAIGLIDPVVRDLSDAQIATEISDRVANGEIDPSVYDGIEALHKTAPQIVGDSASVVLAVYTPSIGAGLAEKGIQTEVQQGFIKSLAQLGKMGLKEGAIQGFQFGVAQALSSGSTDPDTITKIILANTGGGAALGGVISTAVPALTGVVTGYNALRQEMIKAGIDPEAGFARIPGFGGDEPFQTPRQKRGEGPFEKKLTFDDIETRPELFQQSRSLEQLNKSGAEDFKVGEILKNFDEKKILDNPVTVGHFDDGSNIVTSGHNRLEVLKKAKAEGKLTHPDSDYLKVVDFEGPQGLQNAVRNSIETNISASSIKDINAVDLLVNNKISQAQFNEALAYDEKRIKFFTKIAQTFQETDLVDFWNKAVGPKLAILKDADFAVLQERLNFVNSVGKQLAEVLPRLSAEEQSVIKDTLAGKISELLQISKTSSLTGVQKEISKYLDTIATGGFKQTELVDLFGKIGTITEVQKSSATQALEGAIKKRLDDPAVPSNYKSRLNAFLKEMRDPEVVKYTNENAGRSSGAKGTKDMIGKIARGELKISDIKPSLETPKLEKPPKMTEGVTDIEQPSKKQIFNTRNYNLTPEAKANLDQAIETVRPDIEKIRGRKLSHEEVIQAAKESEILTQASTREETLAREATVLRTRQQLSELASHPEQVDEFVSTLKVLLKEKADFGRKLNSLKIKADPVEAGIRQQLYEKMIKLEGEADEILKAAVAAEKAGADFNDPAQARAFYIKYFKPDVIERFKNTLDTYRYINLLSSPKTHIVNTFSNILQATFLDPATKLATGSIDVIASALTGRARQAYVSEVPAYFKGAWNSLGDAVRKAADELAGRSQIRRPDVTEQLNRYSLGPMEIFTRALEASDVFFRTVIEGGEKESLTLRFSRQGKQLTDILGNLNPEIEKAAQDRAAYYIFRAKPDPTNKTGQGNLLSWIDKVTVAIKFARRGGPYNPVKWFVPFVETPMNILKQGIEYSPAGILTLPGAANKTEQLAKATIGSLVFAGAGYLVWKGDATWSVPTNEADKAEFYASGRQPYAIKIGDTWFNYARLGPLSFPIAMAAAIKWYAQEDPKAVTETKLEKTGKIIAGMGKFYSDQSYLQGIGDFVTAAQGDPTKITQSIVNFPSQLVPLAALQRWVAAIVDPIYRKPDSGVSAHAIVQQLEKQIPWLSKKLPAYPDGTGGDAKRPHPLINAFSPVTISSGDTQSDQDYQNILDIRRFQAKSAAQHDIIKSNMEALYQQILPLEPAAREAKVRQMLLNHEITRDEISILKSLINDRKTQGVEAVLAGSNTDVRAQYIYNQIKNMTSQERTNYINDLIKKKIYTRSVKAKILQLQNKAQ